MTKRYFAVNNEDGSVIVIAMLILAVLTILGVSSSNTSTTELNIVRNEGIYQTDFYQAESCAYEALQRIEEETVTDRLFSTSNTYDWINNNTVNLSQSVNWNNFGQSSGIPGDNCDVSLISASAFFSVIANGVRSGSSLDIGSTRLYEFDVYGLSGSANDEVLVEMGYLRRF